MVTEPTALPRNCSNSSWARRTSLRIVGGAPHKRLAERRRHHALGAALEQRRAKLAFELGEAARERRLGDAEMARRGAQAAAFGDGRDVAELGELHAANSSDTELISLDANLRIWLRSPARR